MTKHHTVGRGEVKRTTCAYVGSSMVELCRQDEAIASQISSIADWCDKNDVVLADVFSDLGASGSDQLRPELARMMESATSSARPYGMVIVQSLSCFTRNPAFQVASYARLRAAAVEQVSVAEQ